MRQALGILLAAGRSARFGADKLLLPMADGSPMAVAAARSMLSALLRVVAVVRAEGELAEALRAAGAETLVCPEAERGMGASLAFAVSRNADAAGWIVGLGDMPFVSPATVGAVALALGQGASLAAPVLPDGRRGHPVGFAAAWRPELCALEGDVGGKELLRDHADELVLLDTEDEGCVRDIDRPGDRT